MTGTLHDGTLFHKGIALQNGMLLETAHIRTYIHENTIQRIIQTCARQ
jgi:hypothetical protein